MARRGTGGEARGYAGTACVKDVIEERLFDQRRDLFTDLSAVFMDTTSLSFSGEGGETLGEHGYSKDYRPDLKQMILGLVVDGSGSPLCTEMWPGNTADVTTLLPVIDRLRQRFGIGRGCVVADRGMISAATIAGLEERRLEYILGARERSDALVKKIVMENDDPWVPLLIERQSGETQLFAKPVTIEDQRYIVCRNETEAEKDRNDREAIVAALDAQLKKGDKALVGNSAYRRYLRKTHETRDKPAFEIDAGKLAEEARFDGIFVLRTNAKITPLQAVLRYRDLLKVENLFLRTKAVMRTRPIFHSSDAAIRGHVFCSFLALTMQKYLEDPVTPGRRHPGMEDPSARPRSPAACAHPPSRQRLAGAHRCLQADRRSVPPRSHRAAAARPADGAAKPCPTQNIRPETPRSSQAWCHVVTNFAESSVISIDYRNQVFK